MPHPKEILKALGAAPLKSLSQNFLTSPHWAEKLARAVTEDSSVDAFWEIGPGLGAITEELKKRATKPITVFELDRKVSGYLRDRFPEIELIEGDVLNADFKTLSQGKKIHVLSNLPYHLSSPILFKLAEIRHHTPRLVLTFQREFAARVKAKVGDELYGALTVILQLQYDTKSLGIIPPSAFYPAPDIDSEALVLTPSLTPDEIVSEAIPVVKAAFLHPRKKMVNNLKSVFPDIDWKTRIESLGKTENARAEELTLEDFKRLCCP